MRPIRNVISQTELKFDIQKWAEMCSTKKWSSEGFHCWFLFSCAAFTYMQCWGSEMFSPGSWIQFFPSRIPDPIFSIPDPRSRVDKISIADHRSASKNLSIFNQKTDTKFSKITSGMFIPGLGSWIWIFSHPGSQFRILDPGVKKHWISDPGSRSATLLTCTLSDAQRDIGSQFNCCRWRFFSEAKFWIKTSS